MDLLPAPQMPSPPQGDRLMPTLDEPSLPLAATSLVADLPPLDVMDSTERDESEAKEIAEHFPRHEESLVQMPQDDCLEDVQRPRTPKEDSVNTVTQEATLLSPLRNLSTSSDEKDKRGNLDKFFTQLDKESLKESVSSKSLPGDPQRLYPEGSAWTAPEEDGTTIESPRRTSNPGDFPLSTLLTPQSPLAEASPGSDRPQSDMSSSSSWTPPPRESQTGMKLVAEQEERLQEAVAERPAEEPALPSMPRPQQRPEYDITLDRSTGKKLGIDIDDNDGVTLIVKEMKPGLVFQWNADNKSDVWVHIEDRIVEVNGVSGNAELMMAECMQLQVLHIRMRPFLLPENAPLACENSNPEVFVNIYDLWGSAPNAPAGTTDFGNGARVGGLLVRGVNAAMPSRLGLFHTGVEVYGREWFFCGTGLDIFHGVYASRPRQSNCHRYRKSIAMGRTKLACEDMEELMPLIRMRWPGWSYHLFKRNCHHFTNAFCQILGFQAGPRCGLFAMGDPSLEEDVDLVTQPYRSRPAFLSCCGICGKTRRPSYGDSMATADVPLNDPGDMGWQDSVSHDRAPAAARVIFNRA